MSVLFFNRTENDDGTEEVSFSILWESGDGSSETDSTVVVVLMFIVELGVWVAF